MQREDAIMTLAAQFAMVRASLEDIRAERVALRQNLISLTQRSVTPLQANGMGVESMGDDSPCSKLNSTEVLARVRMSWLDSPAEGYRKSQPLWSLLFRSLH